MDIYIFYIWLLKRVHPATVSSVLRFIEAGLVPLFFGLLKVHICICIHNYIYIYVYIYIFYIWLLKRVHPATVFSVLRFIEAGLVPLFFGLLKVYIYIYVYITISICICIYIYSTSGCSSGSTRRPSSPYFASLRLA